MKGYTLRYGGGLESLSLRNDLPEPVCASHEVIVEIRAASLNFREMMIARGHYPLSVLPELIPCCDGAGQVVEVGSAVRGVSLGDRVMLGVFPRWKSGPFRFDRADQLGGSLNGTLVERVAIDADSVARIPAHLSYEEAATIPCAGVTAWNALTGGASLEAGSTVLTLGSGGVSLFAIQLAKASGARVVATTSSDAKAETLQQLGADVVVNYRKEPGWGDVVRAATGGEGCDVVVEVGGMGTLAQSMRGLKADGTIALVGGLGGVTEHVDAQLFSGVFTLRRIAIGSIVQLHEVLHVVATHALRPLISKIYEFREAPAAFSQLAAGESVGKVVIRVN